MTDYVEKSPAKAPPAEKPCCDQMAAVLEHAEAAPRKVSGIQIVHVFNTQSGEHVFSPIAYVLPTRGSGLRRVHGSTVMIRYCPFCGAFQKGRPKSG